MLYTLMGLCVRLFGIYLLIILCSNGTSHAALVKSSFMVSLMLFPMTFGTATAFAGDSPPWAQFFADRSCDYLRQGHSDVRSGELGAQDVLNSQHAAGFVAAYQGPRDAFEATVSEALITTCPDDLENANQ